MLHRSMVAADAACSYTFSTGNQRQALNHLTAIGTTRRKSAPWLRTQRFCCDSASDVPPFTRLPASREVANFCTVISREDKVDAELRAFRAPGEVDRDIDLRVAAGRDTLQLDRQWSKCLWMTTSGSRRLCHREGIDLSSESTTWTRVVQRHRPDTQAVATSFARDRSGQR